MSVTATRQTLIIAAFKLLTFSNQRTKIITILIAEFVCVCVCVRERERERERERVMIYVQFCTVVHV